eukprot:COSAG02_NODE_23325_length_722_cov_1.054575_1_plen_27_part_10
MFGPRLWARSMGNWHAGGRFYPTWRPS